MTCQESTEKLLDWIEGELSADEAASMKAHVADCADCAKEVENLRTVLDAVVRPAIDPGEEYFERFYTRLHHRIEREVHYTPWTVKLWQTLTSPGLWLKPVMAALALMLVSGGTLVATGVIDWNEPDQTMVAGVSKIKPKPYNQVNLHPQIVANMEVLDEDEVEELKNEIAQVMLPDGMTLVVSEPSSVMSAPSLHKLNEEEIDALADELGKNEIEL